jgi:hypothetical protein
MRALYLKDKDEWLKEILNVLLPSETSSVLGPMYC